jgi:hypothetical protein
MKSVYRSTRRNWVKLWTAEWLRGTSRFELTAVQRSNWIDLLAMAGDSRIPGVVCAGEDADGKLLGYPIQFISALLTVPEQELQESLQVFERQGRISVEKDARHNFIIALTSWERYQSEYHRQKSYRPKNEKVTGKVTSKVTPETTPRLPVEGEGEVDGEVEGEVEGEGESAALAPPTLETITKSFAAMKTEPFGSKKFREIWAQEWSRPGTDGSFSDYMETTIQRCKSLRVVIPGLFYQMKREIEKTEANTSGHEMRRRTPL